MSKAIAAWGLDYVVLTRWGCKDGWESGTGGWREREGGGFGGGACVYVCVSERLNYELLTRWVGLRVYVCGLGSSRET